MSDELLLDECELESDAEFATPEALANIVVVETACAETCGVGV